MTHRHSMLTLFGSFRVHTATTAIEYAERVIATLVAILQQEEPVAITRSASTIRYRRGYAMPRYSSNRLAIFDPGEVSVTSHNNELTIRYGFGLEPIYLPGLLLFVCLLVMALLSHGRPLILSVIAFVLVIIFCGTAHRLYIVHTWLKAGVLNAIASEQNK